MITIQSMKNEQLPLSEAALLFPMRNGKHPHRATLRRWHAKGVRGVKLYAFRVGACWFTTRAAVEQFIKDCNGFVGKEPLEGPPRLLPEPNPQVRRQLIQRGYAGAKAKREMLGVQKKSKNSRIV